MRPRRYAGEYSHLVSCCVNPIPEAWCEKSHVVDVRVTQKLLRGHMLRE